MKNGGKKAPHKDVKSFYGLVCFEDSAKLGKKIS
jgi:hypothetical protein